MTASIKTTFLVALVVLLAFGTLALYRLFPETDPLIEACKALLPNETQSQIKVKLVGDQSVELDMSRIAKASGGGSSEAIAGFLSCIRQKTDRAVVVVDGVYIKDAVPAGEVADQWRSTQERERTFRPLFTLMPGGNDHVLNNLRFGAAAGPAATVIGEWCSNQAAPCVTCEPVTPNKNTINVLVRLRPEANVVKQRLPGTWPTPRPGEPVPPWQIVDASGTRYFYECIKKGSKSR